MEDSSRESNGADVASREDLSLFDEEILFGPNPNDTYFRHLVGDEDNNMIIDDEEADASLQDWVETPMTLPQQNDAIARVVPKASPILSVPVSVNDEDDIEQAEAERKKQERVARIADVPPVVFIGDPNQHMSIRAKKSYIIPDWASLSCQTDLSFVSRNRRAFMLILLLFIVAAIGLVVVLVVNFQSSGRGDASSSTVTSPGGAQDVNVIPSLSPSMTPTPLPTQQVVVNAPTGRPTVQNTPTSILAPVLLETATISRTEATQTTTAPVTTASSTVSPTSIPTTTSPSRPPTSSPTTLAPTISPTTLTPTLSPTQLPSRSLTNEPTSKSPNISCQLSLKS